MRDSFESEYCPDPIHLFEVPDDGTVIFFPVFLEEKKC